VGRCGWGSGLDHLRALQQTSDGGYILGASSESGVSGDKTQASQGNQDYWLVKFNTGPLATTTATSRPVLSVYPNPTRTQLTLALLAGGFWRWTPTG